jgi:hypothetical protein
MPSFAGVHGHRNLVAGCQCARCLAFKTDAAERGRLALMDDADTGRDTRMDFPLPGIRWW